MSLPKTLVIVETDPRTSARAAEGIRIAAGIGVWKKTDVTLLLRGPVAGYSACKNMRTSWWMRIISRAICRWWRSRRGRFIWRIRSRMWPTLEGSPWKYEVIPCSQNRRTGAHQRLPDPFMSETTTPRRILHLTMEGLSADQLAGLSTSEPGTTTEVFPLTETNAAEALEKIFAADTVAVWGQL